MVVAGQQQHAAVLGAAREVAVAKDVAGAVHARALAVPHGIDAVVAAVVEDVALLGAPDSGGRQVLVDACLEVDVVILEEFPRLPELLVEAAERRAAIAGNEAAGVEAGFAVALALHHRQAHEGLRAGQEDASGFQGVLVVEAYGRLSHAFLPEQREAVSVRGCAT